MELKDLLYKVRLGEMTGNSQVDVCGLCFDSRAVQPGYLFVAVKGELTDGHQFIHRAIESGAVAIVLEHWPSNLIREDFPQVSVARVENSHTALGLIADNFYDHPSNILQLVGITGTNGKTTCATLLFQLFISLGYQCGLISTVHNQIGSEVLPASHTTPDAISINILLVEMIEKGCDFCFMEVSSHALVQGRTSGLHFRGGIFTNITHDHLDFHKTFAGYLAAKKSFFDHLPSSAFALTNADDKNGGIMVQNTVASVKKYGLLNLADYKGKVLENHFYGMLLQIQHQEVWVKLIGRFNAYNLLAVFAASLELGEEPVAVLTQLSRLIGAEGRFETISGPHNITGIVDYAHTPDALENVLNTVREIRHPQEKIITVVGCGGDRDKTKRPEMARIACTLSDKVILTSDNPRSEDPGQILSEMAVGIPTGQLSKTLLIQERRSAIQTACHLASPGDIIVLAGKGHEKYQEINGVKLPFDDKKELETVLTNLSA